MNQLSTIALIENPAIDPKIGNVGGVYPNVQSGAPFLQLFLTNFIRIGFVIGAVVFFAMLVIGALEYITSGGDKERTGSASKRMTNALIGMVLLLATYAISRLVNQVFGINLLSLEIPVIQ